MCNFFSLPRGSLFQRLYIDDFDVSSRMTTSHPGSEPFCQLENCNPNGISQETVNQKVFTDECADLIGRTMKSTFEGPRGSQDTQLVELLTSPRLCTCALGPEHGLSRTHPHPKNGRISILNVEFEIPEYNILPPSFEPPTSTFPGGQWLAGTVSPLSLRKPRWGAVDREAGKEGDVVLAQGQWPQDLLGDDTVSVGASKPGSRPSFFLFTNVFIYLLLV